MIKTGSSISNYLFLFFLSIIIFSSYSNTFNSAWQMDDQPNILANYHLHLNSISTRTVINTLYSNPNNPGQLSKKMYRPVPCLTFAINWYFGKQEVFGYHLVNIIIHNLTAFLLFFVITNLFRTPRLEENKNLGFFIAALSTSLWALNPIQTQAVTYIVQRMALLCAFFFILAILFYIKGRLIESYKIKPLYWIGCFFCFILALGSKENAAMLPLILILIEVTFFQDLLKKKNRNHWIFFSLITLILILIFGGFALMKNPLAFLKSYDHRSFTLIERAFAQPRIVLLYISQIFYPLPSRLSIAHDITLSNSIFVPWTTIPSIIIIGCLVSLSILKIIQWPIISFSILFFFINHIIESSIIPLELIFEHRNYLPSLFLFLPISLLINNLLTTYKKSKFIFFLTLILTPCLLIFFSVSTYIRNKAWKTNITLWSDAHEKAPNDARAMNILAMKLAWGKHSTHPNRFDLALQLYEKSLTKKFATKSMEAEIYGNMASIYFNNKKDFEKAISLYNKALKMNPNDLKIKHDLLKVLIINNNMTEALVCADQLIEKRPQNEVYHNKKGLILLWQNKNALALKSFETAFNLHPGKPRTSFYYGVALTKIGMHVRAQSFLEKALADLKDNYIYLYLIENNLKSNDISTASEYANALIESVGPESILNNIASLKKNYGLPPISLDIVYPFIEKKTFSTYSNNEE